LVKELFGGTSPLGQVIRIKRVPFTVIGVLGEKGQTSWGRDLDDVLFLPLSTAKKRVLGGRQVRGNLVRNITVKAVSAEMVPRAEKDVIDLLRRRHRIGPSQPDDFYIRNLAQFMDARAQSSRVMSTMLASVAGISLLVGGIGIMNIMLVSVTERTREIGLRIAVGARRRDIMMQFVTEAVALALIGGLMGIALGIGGSIMVARMAEWPVIIGLEAIVIAAVFSASIGIFFGYYPARKAARLDPIEALRQE
jgi:putative ABC transport system permease protein